MVQEAGVRSVHSFSSIHVLMMPLDHDADQLRRLGDVRALAQVGLAEACPLADLILADSVVDAVKGLINTWKAPKLTARSFTAKRRQKELGVLLSDLAGTGKTTLAMAIAKELKATWYPLDTGNLNEKYVGESEKYVVCSERLVGTD